MSSLMKLFLSIFIIYIINCSEVDLVDDMKENSLTLVDLVATTTQVIFKIKPGSTKMLVELILSHPSNYELTFNQYDQGVEDDDEEILLKSKAKNLDGKFINPKRRLASVYSENQTDLIKSDKSLLGRHKVILNLDE